jgi:GNAT superfamily N-acetyltransferase
VDAPDLDRPRVEPALPTDGAALARLCRELHADNGEPIDAGEALRRLRLLRVTGHALSVCRVGETAAGYALWRERRGDVYLRHFVVGAAWRRRGLGRAFARRVIAAMPPGRDVRLDTATEAAGRFWASLGFRAEARGMRLVRRGREGAP